MRATGPRTVRHEAGKLLKIDLAVAVKVGLGNHRLDLGLSERLAKVVHSQAEFLLRDETVAVPVKHFKNVAVSRDFY